MTFFAEESPPMITSVSTEKDWKEEYRSRRAYAHLTDKQLCERYVSLLENMIEFDDSGSAFIARNSVPYWSKRLCWTEEEFRVRSLMNQAVELKQRELGRPRPQLVAGRKLLSSIELPELGSYIVKFSGSRYVKDMLADGRFRISLASSYNDPSLNPALRDDELTAERFLPAGTRLSVKLEGDYQEIPGIVGPLCHTSHCEDFYVFCAAGIFDPRLFDEFQADACLIVKDLHQFGLALIRGVAAAAGMTKVVHGSVHYLDPAHPSDLDHLVDMTKHFRYEYQKEWRIAWRSEHPLPKDAGSICVEIGPLANCCEAYYL